MIRKIDFALNGEPSSVELDEDMPLLWVLRDALGHKGTKFGCGIGRCGACTVHLDDRPVRSCRTRVASVAGRRVTTIEGLSGQTGDVARRAWIEEDVPQCGYCQAGQLMAAVALLRSDPNPTDEDIDRAMAGNVCRCGTYRRVRRAIHRAAEMARQG